MLGYIVGIALLLIGIIAIIVGVVMTKKSDESNSEKCKDIKCVNGTLQDDCTCVCNSGYSGSTCETSNNLINGSDSKDSDGKGGVGGTGNVAVADSATRKKDFFKKAYDADPEDFKIVASWYILYYPCNPPNVAKCPDDKMATWDPEFDYSTCSFGGCVDTVFADAAVNLYKKHKDGEYTRAEFVEFISLLANLKMAGDQNKPARPLSEFFETYYTHVIPNYPTQLMPAPMADQINKGFEVVDKLDWSPVSASTGGPGEQIYDVGLNPFVKSTWTEVMNRKTGETNESWALRIMLAYYGREPDIHNAEPNRGCGILNAICVAMNGKNTIDAEIWYQLERSIKKACSTNKTMLATAGLYDCDTLKPINMPAISGTVQSSPIPDMWKDVAYVRDFGYDNISWFNAIFTKLTGVNYNGVPVEVMNTFYRPATGARYSWEMTLNETWVSKTEAMNGTLTRGFMDDLVQTLSGLYNKDLSSCTASHCSKTYDLNLDDEEQRECDINCGGLTRKDCIVSFNDCCNRKTPTSPCATGADPNWSSYPYLCINDYSIRCNWNAQWQRIKQYIIDGAVKWIF